jgi:hypothetical protein
MELYVLHRLEGNDFANKLHKIGTNRVFVERVPGLIGNAIVLFEGVPRIVRTVAPVNYECLGGHALYVRFKPIPEISNRLHCRDIDTAAILRYIKRNNQVPSMQKIVFDNPEITRAPGYRLLRRKFAKLYNRGYVSQTDYNGQLYITPKGLNYLEQYV